MSPASACCLRNCRRRPIRSTSSATWRPFRVCRGRRQRNFFSQCLGQLRAADAHARLCLDLRAQAGNGPVGPVGHRRLKQRHNHTQCRLALHRGRAGRHGRLQGRDAAVHEVAAPKPHRIFAHAERLGDVRTGPTGQRQYDRTRTIRLAAFARARQRRQSRTLFLGCRERRLSSHVLHLRIGCR